MKTNTQNNFFFNNKQEAIFNKVSVGNTEFHSFFINLVQENKNIYYEKISAITRHKKSIKKP
jgi:hypothetical protein